MENQLESTRVYDMFLQKETYVSPQIEIADDRSHRSFAVKAGSVCDVFTTEDGVLKCWGYRKDRFRFLLFVLGSILTVGLLVLFLHWMPRLRIWMMYRQCLLSAANVVVLIDDKKNHTIVEVQRVALTDEHTASPEMTSLTFEPFLTSSTCIFFSYKYLNYYLSKDAMSFVQFNGLDCQMTPIQIYQLATGIGPAQRARRLKGYGRNLIDVKEKSFLQVCFEQAADPFYVFQLFSVFLWIADEYYVFAGTIAAITTLSLLLNAHHAKKHIKSLRDMVALASPTTVLHPSGQTEVVSSDSLVPGDVLVIPPEGGLMQCDVVLLSGTCVVNESMLTGESFPTTKVPLPVDRLRLDDETFNSVEHKRHTIYNGTTVLQTRFYGDAKVLAMVVKTGFTTLKGQLIRSVIFPKPIRFSFFRDSMRYIMMLGAVSLVGFSYSMYIFNTNGTGVGYMLRKSLDTLTIIIPPSLPAAMTIGISFAIGRLQRQNISCINPQRVNVCGKLKLFCFDKTGTLTESGLDVSGVHSIHQGTFGTFHSVVSDFEPSPLLFCMATCHGLTSIKGELVGDPLDVKMFDATGWKLVEPGSEGAGGFDNLSPTTVHPPGCAGMGIALLKEYQFESETQRMSMVTRMYDDSSMVLYVKGAPETIAKLSNPSSVPRDFSQVLMRYTEKGYRVLALAYKPLPKSLNWHQLKRKPREDMDTDLELLGLLILQNRLKPTSSSIIRELHDASIRMLMVTGDNPLTAVCVATECSLITPECTVFNLTLKMKSDGTLQQTYTNVASGESVTDPTLEHPFLRSIYTQQSSLVLTGETFELAKSDPVLYDMVLVSASVFARMSPLNKAELVESLQAIGYCVGMCGDGANDCGALKAAHVGIALTEAEASVASPFTSKVQDISCVPLLIKEGRAALATSFGTFKYMATYSFTQYCSVLLLYWSKSNLSNNQFLIVDLIFIMPLVTGMVGSNASERLSRKRPLGRLVHPTVIASLLAQLIIQVGVQVFAFLMVTWFPFYILPKEFGDQDRLYFFCFEDSAVFILSLFLYAWQCLVYSAGPPYRERLYHNHFFFVIFVSCLAFNMALLFYPGHNLQKWATVVDLPSLGLRMALFGLALVALVLSLVAEWSINNLPLVQRFLRRLRRKTRPRNLYKTILYRDIFEISSL